jgi:hypothetical protein
MGLPIWEFGGNARFSKPGGSLKPAFSSSGVRGSVGGRVHESLPAELPDSSPAALAACGILFFR